MPRTFWNPIHGRTSLMTTVDSHIPQEIHTLWETLHTEVCWLHGRWKIYCQLYGTNQERVELLNKSAATFFSLLDRILIHEVQLSLSRLSDPAKTGRHKNMSLDALKKALDELGENDAAEKLDNAIKMFKKACAKVIHRRMKWIAHFDLDTMLTQQVNPRIGPSRKEIEDAMSALRNAMNCINVHYNDMSMAYDSFYMRADGDALIRSLRRGLRYTELVDSGVIAKDDYRTRFRGEA